MYKVIRTTTTRELEEQVTDYLNQGYTLAGELMISPGTHHSTYFQPMIKNIPIEETPITQEEESPNGKQIFKELNILSQLYEAYEVDFSNVSILDAIQLNKRIKGIIKLSIPN